MVSECENDADIDNPGTMLYNDIYMKDVQVHYCRALNGPYIIKLHLNIY